MSYQKKSADELTAVTEKIRSGEFFRESHAMSDFTLHDPMVERYLYLFISILAGLIFAVSVIAVQGLYPLKVSVPFIVTGSDTGDDRPGIVSLITRKGENPSEAVLRFVAQNYVKLREEYDISTV